MPWPHLKFSCGLTRPKTPCFSAHIRGARRSGSTALPRTSCRRRFTNVDPEQRTHAGHRVLGPRVHQFAMEGERTVVPRDFETQHVLLLAAKGRRIDEDRVSARWELRSAAKAVTDTATPRYSARARCPDSEVKSCTLLVFVERRVSHATGPVELAVAEAVVKDVGRVLKESQPRSRALRPRYRRLECRG